MSYPTNNIEPGIRIVGFSLTCVAGSLVPPDGAFRQPFCWGFLSRYPTLSANHFYLASALGAGIDNIGSMQPQISRTYPLLHHLNDFSLQGGGGGGAACLTPQKRFFLDLIRCRQIVIIDESMMQNLWQNALSSCHCVT